MLTVLVLLSACSPHDEAAPPLAPDCPAGPATSIESLAVYTSADVAGLLQECAGVTPEVPVSLSAPASVSLTFVEEPETRLMVPLTIGSQPIPGGGILDTGSAGITADCTVLFPQQNCSALETGQYYDEQGIYVTDIPVTRSYSGGKITQSGYFALAPVTLGSGSGTITAPMPLVVVTDYSSPEAVASGLVGINSEFGGGLISPILYQDFGDLTVGFTVEQDTLTVGLSDTSGFLTGRLEQLGATLPCTMPADVQQLLHGARLATDVTIESGKRWRGPLWVLLDTGTPSPRGGLNIPSGASGLSCQSSCTITASLQEQEVISLVDPSSVEIKDSRKGSLLGLEFLIDNPDSNTFMVDFTDGVAGLLPSAQDASAAHP